MQKTPKALITIAVLILVINTVKVNCDSRRYDLEQVRCENNLRMIDHAKLVLAERESWTNGHGIADTPEQTWKIITSVIQATNLLHCPALPPGTHYDYNPIGTAPTCPHGQDQIRDRNLGYPVRAGRYGQLHVYIPITEQEEKEHE